MLTIKTTVHQDDNTGRWYFRHTPTVETDSCVTGSLTFAFWEVDVTATDAEQDAAKQAALANARDVLRRLAA